MEANLTSPSILVASPQLQDSNFANTVLLLVEHTSSGAFGVILNRPTEVPVATLIANDEIQMPPDIPAWTGGPVGTDNGLILCQNVVGELNSKERITDGVVLSASPAALNALVAHASNFSTRLSSEDIEKKKPVANHPFRFLVGYSGWGPGQLEEELKHGSWIELPLDLNLLFYTPWSKMWESAISCLGINPTKIVPTIQEYLN
jgi:putative transcriptional regulator